VIFSASIMPDLAQAQKMRDIKSQTVKIAGIDLVGWGFTPHGILSLYSIFLVQLQ